MSTECTIQDVFNRFYPDYVKTHERGSAKSGLSYQKLQNRRFWR